MGDAGASGEAGAHWARNASGSNTRSPRVPTATIRREQRSPVRVPRFALKLQARSSTCQLPIKAEGLM